MWASFSKPTILGKNKINWNKTYYEFSYLLLAKMIFLWSFSWMCCSLVVLETSQALPEEGKRKPVKKHIFIYGRYHINIKIQLYLNFSVSFFFRVKRTLSSDPSLLHKLCEPSERLMCFSTDRFIPLFSSIRCLRHRMTCSIEKCIGIGGYIISHKHNH